MANVYFLHQCKHNKTTDNWDKGIVVKAAKPTAKENHDDALQGYHAYLGAYAYGHDPNTDYVACYVMDEYGNRPEWEVWGGRIPEPEPEQEG